MHDAGIGVALIAGGFAMSYFLPKLFWYLRRCRKNNWSFSARVCAFFASFTYAVGIAVATVGLVALIAMLSAWLRCAAMIE